MKPEKLQIKFEGEQHQIDANTLVNTLIHYSALVNEINNIYGEGSRKVNIKINAIEKGSFVIDISLIESLSDIVLFAKRNIDYAYKIGGLAVSVVTLYKIFKGRKIDENKRDITNINIQNNINIDNKTIINIYNNPVVRESISKSIETANNDESVEGISFATKDEKTEILKSEFPDLIYDDFDKETEHLNRRDIIDKDVALSIITLSFDKNKKWEFLYKGFKISVPVKDKGLRLLIDGGLRFAKGDSIVVDIEITQQFSTEYNDYVNKKYSIIEFKKHLPRPDQQSLSFEN
jgi:hypothetical protein